MKKLYILTILILLTGFGIQKSLLRRIANKIELH